MKRFAILCPGPFVELTWGAAKPEDYERVIAVNKAALLGCDWWQAHDRGAFDLYGDRAKVRVGICTWSHIYEAYAAGRFPMRSDLGWIDAEELPDAGFRYHCLSMLGAMGLAVFLGAQEVDIFGADWCGESYFGDNARDLPADHRWDKHREYFDQCCAAWDHVRFKRVLYDVEVP